MTPNDGRLTRVASRVNPHPFEIPKSLEAWEERARALKRRVRVATCQEGWERGPVEAEVFDGVRGDGFTVYKVLFETLPGFYATGNLFVPDGQGPFPAVINLFGHWRGGRLEHSDRASTLSRGVALSRMGIVAFVLDTVGYNDSIQVEHRFGGPAERLWAIGPARLQAANMVRSVDFVAQLPYVDASRIGCDGASGGGTHVLVLAALDERIRAVAVVNSVAAHTQPECPCETPPFLRVGTNNLHFAALVAPRPMQLTSCTGDWTKNTPEVEYPALRAVYELYSAADRLSTFHQDAPHNYNAASRAATYRFFARWLLGDPDRPIEGLEVDLPCPREELLIFPGHPKPRRFGTQAEVIAAVKAADAAAAAIPRAQDGFKRANELLGGQLRHLLGEGLDRACGWKVVDRGGGRGDGYEFRRYEVGTEEGSEAIPITIAWPEAASPVQRGGQAAESEVQSRGEAGAFGQRGGSDSLFGSAPAPAAPPVLLLHDSGQGFFWRSEETGSGRRDQTGSGAPPQGGCPGDGQPGAGPGPLIRALLQKGRMVCTADLFLTGSYQSSPIGTAGRNTAIPSFECYNLTDAACRARDVGMICAALAFGLRTQVSVAAFGEAALWAALGIGLTPAVASATLEIGEWDESEATYLRRLYVPHLLRLGGLKVGWLAFAPRPLRLFTGAASVAGDARAIYEAAGAAGQLRVHKGPFDLARHLELLCDLEAR